MRKNYLIQAANRYSDIAVRDGTAKAARIFFDDYLSGKMTSTEHVFLMCLVQQYIDCKRGVMTRAACVQAQTELFRKFEDQG